MKTLLARVERGRLTELPEGTRVALTLADDTDDLDDEERATLDASIDDSWASVEAGDVRPVEELIAELRARG